MSGRPISLEITITSGRLLQVTVRPILRHRCLLCLSVCIVDVLWLNDWMDQDATWHRGRPGPRRHYVRRGHSSPTERGTATPLFDPYLLWSKGRPSQQLLSSC